jgi:hypothetical protein
MRRMLWLPAVWLLALALVLGGCRANRPQPGLEVSVLQQGEGLTIIVKTTNFSVPRDGHIHIRLDDGPEAMAYSQTYTIPRVSPGNHKVTVQLSDTAHRNLGIQVEKTIEIK